MPKFGIHYVILRNAVNKMQMSSIPEIRTAVNEINNNQGVSNLGCIGPDMFFFAPDYAIVDKLYDLYKMIENVIDLYNKVMAPIHQIKQEVGDALDTIVGNLPGVGLVKNLVGQINTTKDLFTTAITNLMTAAIGSQAGSFYEEFFKPPLQNNEPIDSWYWFDMLHYRSAGDFASNLISLANSPTTRAYAYGYMSHIGGDTIGHGYVNQVVGGPYRLNVQRHVTVESYMDTWMFHTKFNERVTRTLFDRLDLPPPPLQKDLVDLLSDAFKATYGGQPRPRRMHNDGFLTKDDIRETYEILYEMLKISKSLMVDRPEEPFSGVADILEGIMDDLFEPPPSPPSSSSTTCSFEDIFSFGLTQSSRDCYDEFFDNFQDWLDYIGELLRWAVETLADLLNLLVSLLLTLPVSVLLAILYGIQLLCYEIYQTTRSSLALQGIVLPEPEDLNTAHAVRLITTALGCGAEKMSQAEAAEHKGQIPYHYPKVRKPGNSHLICPDGGVELPTTRSDFHKVSQNIFPDEFIDHVPFDIKSLRAYAQSPSDETTRALQLKEQRIGNAVDLTQWMIETHLNPNADTIDKELVFTNWNLDSDRGYGYKQWEATLPDIPSGDPPDANEKYV